MKVSLEFCILIKVKRLLKTLHATHSEPSFPPTRHLRGDQVVQRSGERIGQWQELSGGEENLKNKTKLSSKNLLRRLLLGDQPIKSRRGRWEKRRKVFDEVKGYDIS